MPTFYARTCFATTCIAMAVLTACNSGQHFSPSALATPGPTRVARPNLAPGPVPSVPASVPLFTVTYQGRPETAQTRGSCAAGYMYDVFSQPHVCVYDGNSSDPIVARVGTPYPFSLGLLHCGIEPQFFDAAVFIVAQASPEGVSTGLGTMTRIDPYHARYVDSDGTVITFVAVSSVQVPGCM